MNKAQIMAEVAAIIRKTFRQPDAVIERDTTALEIDGWDSLSHTVLILDIERQFGISLPADRVFELADVGELVDLVFDSVEAG